MMTMTLLLAAAIAPSIGFQFTSNSHDQRFRLGEEAVITAVATNGAGERVTSGIITVKFDDWKTNVLRYAKWDLSKQPSFTVKGTRKTPGFLRVAMSGDGVCKKACRWGVGYEAEKIVARESLPADFDEFWQKARASLAATVPLDPKLDHQPELSKGAFDFYRVSFATYGGTRVWGFLSVPKDRSKAPFGVDFGVSSAGEGKWTISMDGRTDRIRMYFTVHREDPARNIKDNLAFHARLREQMKKEFGQGHYAIAGLDGNLEDFYFYRTLLGIDRVVDWLAARPDVDRTRFDYKGGSQGGYFGWMLCGLNHTFTSAVLCVPAGSDIRGAYAERSSCWPNPFSSFSRDKHEKVWQNLGYFDGLSFARRIKCPICVVVGLTDNTCPPQNVYATYNASSAPMKCMLEGIGMGHGGQTAPMAAIATFWQEKLRHLGHVPRVTMPESCRNPDGMAVAPDGALVVAAPNGNRKSPGAIFRIEKPGQAPTKWFDVPVTAKSGFASPMGICFGPDGALYVCDNQPNSDGRLLRIIVDRASSPCATPISSCDIVATGLENANGVKSVGNRLYLTQAFQTREKRADGKATSALYMFATSDRNVRVTNTSADKQRVFTDTTANPQVRGGLNGVCVVPDGTLYVGNYGDGHLWRLTLGADGRVVKSAKLKHSVVKTADGLCADDKGNVYCADMQGNALVRFTPQGYRTILARNCFVRPSEPCFWKGAVYVADYGSTTLTVVAP